MASAIAMKLDPRPEIRIPSRLLIGQRSCVHHAVAANHFADLIPALAQALEHLGGLRQVLFGNHQDHPDTQVEGPPPVLLGDISDLPQQLEHRQDGPRSVSYTHLTLPTIYSV